MNYESNNTEKKLDMRIHHPVLEPFGCAGVSRGSDTNTEH